MVVSAIVVVGMFLLLLYSGLSRYYNAQKVDSLVHGRLLTVRPIRWKSTKVWPVVIPSTLIKRRLNVGVELEFLG